jgi:hypothetical protein
MGTKIINPPHKTEVREGFREALAGPSVLSHVSQVPVFLNNGTKPSGHRR